MRANLLTVAVLLIGIWVLASRPSSAQIAPASLHAAPVAVRSGRLSMLGPAGVRGVPKSAAQPAAATVLFDETFEGAWPGTSWTLFDRSTNGDAYLWGQRDCQPFSGAYSAMAAGGGSSGSTRLCASTYPNNVESWAIYGPLDLSGVTTATLTFFVEGKTEGPDNNPVDYLFVGSSIDGNNFSGGTTGGDLSNGPFDHGYYRFSFDMTDRAGQSQVWVAFLFVSDKSVTDSGLTIDDIQISGEPIILPTATSTTTPTSNPTAIPPTPTLQQAPNLPVYIPMIVSLFAPADCPGAGANDTPTHASPVTSNGRACLGTFQSQPVGASHWYYADVSAGQTIDIDMTGIPGGADFDIYLFDSKVVNDSTAKFISSSEKFDNANEHISYSSPTSMRYYIRALLRSKAPNSSNTYLLAVARH